MSRSNRDSSGGIRESVKSLQIDMEDKATKAELSAISASPKGVFTTLTDLQTDTGANSEDGKKSVYLITADGKWYYWSETAWTAGGTYQSTGIANNSITQEKTTFLSSTINLFNQTTVKNGTQILYNSGDEAVNALFNCSDFIAITPNVAYTFSDCGPTNLGVLYDSNKVFVANVTGTTDSGASVPLTKTFTQSNVAYIRLNFLVSRDIDITSYMVVLGLSMPSIYSPHGFTSPNLILSESNILPIIDATTGAVNASLVNGTTDSDLIENAIALALTGNRVVSIPTISPINGNTWLLDRAIQLPNDFTLILNNCYIKLKNGVNDNIIRTENVADLSTGQNINIIGIGNAAIDGNGINQTTISSSYKRIGLLLFNVNGFKVDGIRVKNTHGWGMSFESGCCYGTIKNIIIDQDGAVINQDGIDIRDGCHHIDIDNITGFSDDDFIALTALGNNVMQVVNDGSKGMDIHHINLSNIKGESGYCNLIDLICHDGRKLHDITMDNIVDTSEALKATGEFNAVINIGNYDFSSYALIRPSQDGEMYNIKINNVTGRGMYIIHFSWFASNIHISNVTARDDFRYVFRKSCKLVTDFILRDVFIDGVYANNNEIDTLGDSYGVANWVGIFANFLHGATNNLSVKNVKIGKMKNIIVIDTTSVMQSACRFSNFDISETSHQVYSVKNDNVKIHLDNFYCMDRSKIYQSDVAKTTQFYSALEAPNSVIEIGTGMPEILAIDIPPI